MSKIIHFERRTMMPHTNYYFMLTALLFYYTIIVTFRVPIQQGFLNKPFFVFPNFIQSSKITNKTTKNKQKKQLSSIKKSNKIVQKKKKSKKQPPHVNIKNYLLKIGKPSKNQLLIISLISFISYFISNSMETLIITFLYLCLIYTVSLIYLAYIETKEENERLKQEILKARKRRKKNKLKKTN